MRYQKALILGGSSGLGLEIAKGCLFSGVTELISVSSSQPDRQGEHVRFIQCDFNNNHQVNTFAAMIGDDNEKSLADIDLFFWVAGVLHRHDFADLNLRQVRAMLDVNLNGPLVIAHAVWQQMQLRNRSAHFVVVSSSSGIKPRAAEAVYVAAKHAQVGFTRSLALENKDHLLHVLLVMPGGMKTPFWNRARPNDYNSFLDPGEVASRIIQEVTQQQEETGEIGTGSYRELQIPRGSL